MTDESIETTEAIDTAPETTAAPAVPAIARPAAPATPAPAPARRVAPRRAAEETPAPFDPAELEAARRQLAEVNVEREKLSAQTKLLEDARRAAEGERDRVRIESQVQKLAAKYGVHGEAMDDFVELCASKLTVNADGTISSRGDKPVAADEFVASYLKSRPHMLAAKVARGSGASSSPSVSGPVGEVVKIDPKDGASLTRFLAVRGARAERR